MEYCRAKYTDLAIVRNQTENDMVQQVIGPHHWVWIGLHRLTWRWTNGIGEYRTWAHGHPKGSGGNCVSMVFPQGTWVEKPCDTKMHFMCQSSELLSPWDSVTLSRLLYVSNLFLNARWVFVYLFLCLITRQETNVQSTADRTANYHRSEWPQGEGRHLEYGNCFITHESFRSMSRLHDIFKAKKAHEIKIKKSKFYSILTLQWRMFQVVTVMSFVPV